jgi:hypothetical protein
MSINECCGAKNRGIILREKIMGDMETDCNELYAEE